jgi:hypothetical protein
MTYKATELVYDMYYASERTEDGGKVAKITVQIRDASVGLEKQISTLVRTTPKDKAQPAVYSIGAQTVMDGSDPRWWLLRVITVLLVKTCSKL